MGEYIIILVICALFCGAIGGALGGSVGFLLGVLLGPIGVICAAIVGKSAKQKRHPETAGGGYSAVMISRMSPVLHAVREVEMRDDGDPDWVRVKRVSIKRLQSAIGQCDGL